MADKGLGKFRPAQQFAAFPGAIRLPAHCCLNLMASDPTHGPLPEAGPLRPAQLPDEATAQALGLPPLGPRRPAAWSLAPAGQRLSPPEAARLAAAVYGPSSGALPPGWRPSALPVPGAVWAEAPGSKTGFNSALYERGRVDGTVEYAYVTQGTDLGSLRDWLTNLKQALGGPTRQYARSVANARLLAQALPPGTDLTFVGHSLGGGLASANALATGRPGITFNAAGLSPATRHGLAAPALAAGPLSQLIMAYVVDNEIVSRLQSVRHLLAEGDVLVLPTDHHALVGLETPLVLRLGAEGPLLTADAPLLHLVARAVAGLVRSALDHRMSTVEAALPTPPAAA